MAILTKASNQKLSVRSVHNNERTALSCTLGGHAPLPDPGCHAPVKTHHIAFSAVRTEAKVVVRKGSVDFVEKRLRHKEGAAFLALFHFHRSDFLLGKNAEKVSRTDLMPEFRCIFRAGIDAGSTADALVVGVIEDPQRAFVRRFERARGAAQLAGGAPCAAAGVQPGSDKEENSHENHGFTAQDMDQPDVVPEESNLIQGPVTETPTREKREPCDENDDEISPRRPSSCFRPENPPGQEKQGDGYHQEGHPVSSLVRDGGPGPTEPGFLPQADMASQPDGHDEKTQVKHVADNRVKGLFGNGLVEGQKEPAEDGHRESPS
jgi:hypothetical protein